MKLCCPSCQSRLVSATVVAGRKVKCPRCGTGFTAGATAPQRTALFIAIGLGAVGLLLLLTAGAMIAWALTHQPSPVAQEPLQPIPDLKPAPIAKAPAPVEPAPPVTDPPPVVARLDDTPSRVPMAETPPATRQVEEPPPMPAERRVPETTAPDTVRVVETDITRSISKPAPLSRGDFVGRAKPATIRPKSVAKLGGPPMRKPEAAEPVTFFQSKGAGKRIMYIADASGSMKGDRLNSLKRELSLSLSRLSDEQEFFVIFFNFNAVPIPSQGWLKGKKDVAKAVAWIDMANAGGGTNPVPAFKLALDLNPRPDVIFFLTDGLMNQAIPPMIAQLNGQDRKVPINAILFAGGQGPELRMAQRFQGNPFQLQQFQAFWMAQVAQASDQLQGIARLSGGTFTIINAAAIGPAAMKK